ncbi:MAG: hypothetical protein ACREJC_04280, partial [Tepidisphaeraceae bacterium]
FYATAEDGYRFVGAPQSATVVITGSPGPCVVTISNVNDAIREKGTIAGTFEIRRTGLNESDLIVNIGALSGTGLATPGSDYYELPPTVTIPAGQDAVRLRAYPLADAETEPSEPARVAVQPGAGYTVGADAVAGISIRDASSPAVVAVTSSQYDSTNVPIAVRMAFSDSVAPSLSLADITLENLSTGEVVPTSELGLGYDPSSGIARVYARSLQRNVLPDGAYRLTLDASGVSGPGGVPLDGNDDGVGGDDHVLNFAVGTAFWDGGGDGINWIDPQNWQNNSLPGLSDNVIISVSGNPTIQLHSGTQSIKSLLCDENLLISSGTLDIAQPSTIGGHLTLTNGSITGAGSLTLSGLFDWSGGAMSGTGKTIIASGATLNITGNTTKTLSRTLENNDTINWTAGNIDFVDGTLVNKFGATFDAAAPIDFATTGLLKNVAGTNLFDNFGTFHQTAGFGTYCFVPLDNRSGANLTADAQIRLYGGGTSFG